MMANLGYKFEINLQSCTRNVFQSYELYDACNVTSGPIAIDDIKHSLAR